MEVRETNEAMCSKMIKLGLGLLLFCWAESISAQQNLVPNPSFEEYIICPSGDCSTNIDNFPAISWYNSGGSPDYYNICGTGCWNLYTAWGGGGGAQEGYAYIGLIVRGNTITFPNVREYIQAKLSSSLTMGHKYNCSFWVMLSDSGRYATKNIGVFFSKDTIIPILGNEIMLANPQIRYQDSLYLNEKEKWQKIVNSFIAEGGENYICIGNFDKDIEMQVSYLEGNGVIDTTTYWQNRIYYFIDNVSIIEDTSYHPIGIEEELIKRIQVNYSNGQLQTEGLLFQNNNTAIELYSLSGSKIVALPLKKGNEKQNVNLDGLANGVYLYALKLNNEVVKRGKILIRD